MFQGLPSVTEKLYLKIRIKQISCTVQLLRERVRWELSVFKVDEKGYRFNLSKKTVHRLYIHIHIAVTFKDSCISHTEHINVFRVIFRINNEYFFIENWVNFHSNWNDILFVLDTEFSSTPEKKLKISKNILLTPDNTEHRWNKEGSWRPGYLLT